MHDMQDGTRKALDRAVKAKITMVRMVVRQRLYPDEIPGMEDCRKAGVEVQESKAEFAKALRSESPTYNYSDEWIDGVILEEALHDSVTATERIISG